jgi:hypothetical protein
VPVAVNPYASKDQAMREAVRIQQILPVEISDNSEEGITQLAQTGKSIDAVIALRRQRPDMTLTQAKDMIDHMTGRRTPTL